MYLVTGGAGFIGSHLVEALLARGEKVRILDNLITGKISNLNEATGSELPSGALAAGAVLPLGRQAEFLYGDVSDLETCRRACQGASFVFHEAALGSVPRSIADPVSSHQSNATGTLNLLQAAKEMGVKRVVYASSSSVYGNTASRSDEGIPKEESLPPNPQSPYAVTKLTGETYCRIFARLYPLETVSLRYFNVFGPRQDPHSIYAAVIPRFITSLLKGESAVIYGDGQQSRDFTYVGNVIQANGLAMETGGISGELFNIACGGQTSVNALLAYLQEIGGTKIAPRHVEPRPGEVRHSLAAIEKARSSLGYEVKTDLQKGLAVTWEWFANRIRSSEPKS